MGGDSCSIVLQVECQLLDLQLKLPSLPPKAQSNSCLYYIQVKTRNGHTIAHVPPQQASTTTNGRALRVLFDAVGGRVDWPYVFAAKRHGQSVDFCVIQRDLVEAKDKIIGIAGVDLRKIYNEREEDAVQVELSLKQKRGVMEVGAVRLEMRFREEKPRNSGSGLRIFLLDAWVKCLELKEEVHVRVQDGSRSEAITTYAQPDDKGYLVWDDYVELQLMPATRLELGTRTSRKVVAWFELKPESIRIGNVTPLRFETADHPQRQPVLVQAWFSYVDVSTPVQGELSASIHRVNSSGPVQSLYAVLEAFPCDMLSRGVLYAPGLARTGISFSGESVSTSVKVRIQPTAQATIYLCNEVRESNCVIEQHSVALSTVLAKEKVEVVGEHASFVFSFNDEPADESPRFIHISRGRRLNKRTTGLFKVGIEVDSVRHETEPMRGPNPKWDAYYDIGNASPSTVVNIAVVEMPDTVVAKLHQKLSDLSKTWIDIGASAQLLVDRSHCARSPFSETTGRRVVTNEGHGYLHCSIRELRVKGLREDFTSGSLYLSGARKKFHLKADHRVAVPLHWSFHEKKIPVLVFQLQGQLFRMRVDSVVRANDGTPSELWVCNTEMAAIKVDITFVETSRLPKGLAYQPLAVPCIVQLTLHDALLHHARDWMDPFVKVSLDTGPLPRASGAAALSTVDVDGGKNPRWEERVVLPLDNGCARTPLIRLEVFHEKTLLGLALLPLPSSVVNHGHLVQTRLSLANDSFEKTGEITISVQLVPNEVNAFPCQVHVAFAEGLPSSEAQQSYVSLCVADREICRTVEASGTSPVWNETLISWIDKAAISVTHNLQAKICTEEAVISVGDVRFSEDNLDQLKTGNAVKLNVQVELSHGTLRMEVFLGRPIPVMPEALQHIQKVTLRNVIDTGRPIEEGRIVLESGRSKTKSGKISAVAPGTLVWEPTAMVLHCEPPVIKVVSSGGGSISVAQDKIELETLVLPLKWYHMVEVTVSGLKEGTTCAVEFNIPAVQSKSFTSKNGKTVQLEGRVSTAFPIRPGEWVSLSACISLKDKNGMPLGAGVIDLGKVLAQNEQLQAQVLIKSLHDQGSILLDIFAKGSTEEVHVRGDHCREVEELKALFYKVDADGNGCIDVEEFKRIGNEHPPLRHFDFASLDTNNDSKLDWKEFERMITRSDQKQTNAKDTSEELSCGISPRATSESSTANEVQLLRRQLEAKETELKAAKLAKKFIEEQSNQARLKHSRKGLWKRAITLSQRERHEAELSAFKHRLNEQSNAASKLQAVYRSAQPRKEFLVHQASRRSGALLIQRIVRTKQAFAKLRQQSIQRNTAASTLQRVYRGFQVKRGFTLQRQGAQNIQRVFRGRKDRMHVLEAKTHNEATKKLQGFYRFFAASRALFALKIQREEANAAALTLQQSFRSHRAREELMVKRVEANENEKARMAAITLQRMIRGAHARMNDVTALEAMHKKRNLASIRIQSKARQRISHKVMQRKKREIDDERRRESTARILSGDDKKTPIAQGKVHTNAELTRLLEEECVALVRSVGGLEGRDRFRCVMEVKRAMKMRVKSGGRERLLQLLSRIKGLGS